MHFFIHNFGRAELATRSNSGQPSPNAPFPAVPGLSKGGTQLVLVESNSQEDETLLLVTVLEHPLLSVGEIKNALQLYRQERTSPQGNQAA